jgi:hypothetical protein
MLVKLDVLAIAVYFVLVPLFYVYLLFHAVPKSPFGLRDPKLSELTPL